MSASNAWRYENNFLSIRLNIKNSIFKIYFAKDFPFPFFRLLILFQHILGHMLVQYFIYSVQSAAVCQSIDLSISFNEVLSYLSFKNNIDTFLFLSLSYATLFRFPTGGATVIAASIMESAERVQIPTGADVFLSNEFALEQRGPTYSFSALY